jgi:hypothetical protein
MTLVVFNCQVLGGAFEIGQLAVAVGQDASERPRSLGLVGAGMNSEGLAFCWTSTPSLDIPRPHR